MTDSPIIVVKSESPVTNQASKLFKWDSSARKYFSMFELELATLRKGISLLFKNPVTSMRDPI